MNEMIERVAKAEHDQFRSENPGAVYSWEELAEHNDPLCDVYRRRARAAIAAMREPTRDMIRAGYERVYETNPTDVRNAYWAMIGEALKE